MSGRALTRICVGCGVPCTFAADRCRDCATIGQQRPMPNEFPTAAPGMTLKGMRRRWRTSDKIIERWWEQAGLPPRVKQVRPVPQAEVVSPTGDALVDATIAMFRRRAPAGMDWADYGSLVLNAPERLAA